MKTLIALLLLCFATLSISANAQSHQTVIQGRILSTLVGEFDPHLIGDACLIEIELANDSVVGILTDFNECAEEDLIVGRGIVLVAELNNQISSEDYIEILRFASRASNFFFSEYGAIENGLADQ
jgi:hypothetical protein